MLVLSLRENLECGHRYFVRVIHPITADGYIIVSIPNSKTLCCNAPPSDQLPESIAGHDDLPKY